MTRAFVNRTMIASPHNTQMPFLEYDLATGRWRIWQSFNGAVTEGTYLDLYPEGRLERVTDHPDGSVSITIMALPPPKSMRGTTTGPVELQQDIISERIK